MKTCEIRTLYGSLPASEYFGGQYRGYGRYQWCIKYHRWQDEAEIEVAVNHYFGSYDYKTQSFYWIDDLLGRPVKAHIDGRSGGWFVIDEKLAKSDLAKVDDFIYHMLEDLSDFLSDEREYHKSLKGGSL
jgi:hypothetical protein